MAMKVNDQYKLNMLVEAHRVLINELTDDEIRTLHVAQTLTSLKEDGYCNEAHCTEERLSELLDITIKRINNIKFGINRAGILQECLTKEDLKNLLSSRI